MKKFLLALFVFFGTLTACKTQDPITPILTTPSEIPVQPPATQTSVVFNDPRLDMAIDSPRLDCNSSSSANVTSNRP